MVTSLHVLIPLLNESHILEKHRQCLLDFVANCRQRQVEITFVDGGSDDGSVDFLRKNSLSFVGEKLASPTISKTLLIAKKSVRSTHVWVVPVDCIVTVGHLELVLTTIKQGRSLGYFTKTYDSNHPLLVLQQSYLNLWRTQYRGHFVWTNCPFLLSTLLFDGLEKYPDFLSDVCLSRDLGRDLDRDLGKDNVMGRTLVHPVSVSSRRYLERGVFKQMTKNLRVLWQYRRGSAPSELEKLYQNKH